MSGPRGFLGENAPWLLAGFLLTFASSFGQTFFISVFSGEIRAAYGLSHGAWGGIYMAATMASAAVMVFAGGITDRLRVRVISGVVFAGLATACLLMAGAFGLWSLVLAVFLLRLLGQGMMGHTAMVAMSRWFVARRGRAVSIAGLGVSAGEALLPLLFVALLGLYDWRTLWVLAALVLAFLSPVLWRLLRRERTPQSFAAEPGMTGMNGRSWTRREMMRHGLFWLMVPAVMGPAAWNTALFFHQVHIAEIKGWGHPALVALFPVFTASAVGAMLLSGWAVDRFGTGRLAAVYLLPMAGGYAALAASGGIVAGGLGLMLIGLGVGANNTMSSAFWAEHFGTAHFGAIRAATVALMVLGTAVGPAITGVLIDRGFDFAAQSWGLAAYFLVASLLAGSGATRAAPALRAV